MLEKKKLLINCDLCDTRKIKEEDYSHFEQITINTDVILVNENSKSILNRLPALINQDKTILLPEDVDVDVKSINGSHKITGSTMVSEHTILFVNGSLTIESGTEEVLQKYERIIVNGSVTCPDSLEGYLGKIAVNGSATTYPDGCVILKENFVMDKYFPLRAKENGKYYAKKKVVIQGEEVDVKKLVDKKVQFTTEVAVLPESKVEECACIFNEETEFVVVPEGMKLIADDVTLEEKLIRKEGNRLFVYGDVEVGEKADMDQIEEVLEKLIVKGTLSIRKKQMEVLERMDVEYDELEILDDRRTITNVLRAKIDRALLENCEEGVRVCNAAKVVLAKDVDCALILEKLRLVNCAKVSCSEEQESAVAAVATNVAQIGQQDEEADGNGAGNILGNVFGMVKNLADTKIINADEYIM